MVGTLLAVERTWLPMRVAMGLRGGGSMRHGWGAAQAASLHIE